MAADDLDGRGRPRANRSPPAAVLAVDGGNSKTDVGLVAADGTVLGTARGPGSSHQALGIDGSLGVLDAIVARACAAAGIDGGRRPVARAGAYCLAGADLPVDERRLSAALTSRRWAYEPLIRNDTFAVLRAGTERPWGVAIVCGAGMNCVGVAPDGRAVRFPALGLISGDWGGGYWVGMGALAAAVRGRDRRGPRTVLERMVPAHFGLARPAQVVEAIYLGRLHEGAVVELAPVVFIAARQGDAVADELIARLGDEIVAMAGAAIRRLRMTRLDVDVVVGGGLFDNGHEGLMDRVQGGVEAVAPLARLRHLDAPPLVGAVLLGLDRLGAAQGAASRVRRALTNERLSEGSTGTRSTAHAAQVVGRKG